MKKNENNPRIEQSVIKEEQPLIVAIGASAGGLEALQDFFKNLPLKTGMAFVVIQHLSPDYKSLMDELLARYTQIPIKIITDGMLVEPDHIYLIPPRKNLYIFHQKLFLEDQNLKRGLNLPVDIFFRSLATEMGKRAIGVILSGTGSDGTLGTRAIKEAGGMIIVQDESTAKFDGMPRSSVATGLVDYILPPAKMPEAIINYIKHPFVSKEKALDNILTKNIDTLSKIIMILRDYSGIDFSYYKENTITRRLERRVSINRFDSLDQYLIFLSESDKEKEILFRELLIGVTRFFRDAEAFESLKENVISKFGDRKSLRIWSIGCSTGEEVYSIAFLISDYIDKNNLNCEVKIFATDIDKQSLDIASQGLYPDNIVADIDPYYLKKYFVRRESGYQVHEQIRKMIVFANHNLLKDPPFSKIDLIICRNLFIYLKPEVQQRLLSIFFYSLSPSGVLFMGNSETIGEMSEAFDAIDARNKIYACKTGYKPPIIKDLPIPTSHRGQDYESNLFSKRRGYEGLKIDKLMDTLLGEYLPPSVIIDQNDYIIHVINNVSEFVRLQPGKFSQNLYDNLPNELGLFVSTQLRKLKRENQKTLSEIVVGIKSFEDKKVQITTTKIELDKTTLYLISFSSIKDKEPAKRAKKKDQPLEIDRQIISRVSELEKELQYTKENLQATVEELETSNEELQSSNEELIASNEELQSTNEELQSVNEELYTVNSEYQNKIEELSKLNNDMNNLLRNTEVGALYLDRNLCIRKITPLVTKITNIMQNDIGRPINHITVLPNYSQIYDDLNSVVETLQAIDREILTKDGKWYLVRLRPYRTDFNAVDGFLITFVEITKLIEERNKVRDTNNKLESVLQLGKVAWWEWDLQTNKVTMDDAKATMIGYKVEEFPTDVYEVCNLIHPDDYEKTMKLMKDFLEGKSDEWNAIYRIRRKDGKYSWYYDRGHFSEYDENRKPTKITGAVFDVTNLKEFEYQLSSFKQLTEKIIQDNPYAITIVDSLGSITYANKKSEELFGIKQSDITNRTFNSPDWKIEDLDGKPIDPANLPYSIVKNTLAPIEDYQHYIYHPEKGKKLISITGSPILDEKGKFVYAFFIVREIS